MNTAKQAAIHSFGAVVMLFALWVISVFLVRADGYESAGVFSLAMSIANIFYSFAYYNFRNYRITDVKGEFTQEQYFTASAFTIALSFVMCAAYAVLARNYTILERSAIFAYFVFYIINCVAETLFAYIQVKGRLELNGYSFTIRGCVFMASFAVSFLLTRDLVGAIMAMALSNLLVLLLFDVPAYRRITGERISFCFRRFREVVPILRNCFPLMLTAVLPMMVTAIPRRAIQAQLGEEMLGYFSSIFTITTLITAVAPLVVSAFLPGIAKVWNDGDNKKVLKLIFFCYAGVAVFMAAAAIASAIAGRFALKLIFGEEILKYFPLLYWSILVAGFYAMTTIGNGILTTIRKEKLVTAAVAVDLIVVAAFSGPAVSAFNIYGGVYVLIAAHILQAVVQLCFILPCIRTGKKNN